MSASVSAADWPGYLRALVESAGATLGPEVLVPVSSAEGVDETHDLVLQDLGPIPVRVYVTAETLGQVKGVPFSRWPEAGMACVRDPASSVERKVRTWCVEHAVPAQVRSFASLPEAMSALSAQAGNPHRCAYLAVPDSSPLPSGSGLVEVSEIARVPCFLAVRRDRPELRAELTAKLERLLIEDRAAVDRLRERYLGVKPPAEGRRVVVGRYLEPGLCRFLRNGDFEGGNEDCIARIAAINGWQVEWVFANYEHQLKYLERGQIDLLAGVTMLSERLKLFDFPHVPTSFYRLFLFARAGAGYDTGRSWDEATIAFGPGAQSEGVLRDFIRQRGVRCKLRQYPTAAEAVTAYHRGECDMLYVVGSTGLEGERVLHVFTPVPCYVCMPLNRPALREQVETALVRITEVLRDCDRDGNERHFIVHEDAGSIFSPDDLSWIKRRKAAARPVRVDISPLLPPLKAWNAERSEPEGFIRALFDEFSRQTGLDFEFLPPVSAAEARQRFERGEMDLWCDFIGEGRGLSPYGQSVMDLGLRLLSVVRKDQNADSRTSDEMIVVPRWARNLVRNSFGEPIGARLTGCMDGDEAFQMVIDGKADRTIAPLAVASDQIRRLNARDQLEFRALKTDWRLALPLLCPPSAESQLVEIVGKAARAISLSDADVLSAHAIVDQFRAPLLSSGQVAALAALLFVLVIGLVLLVVIRYARQVKFRVDRVRKVLEERNAFVRKSEAVMLEKLNVIEARAESLRSPDASREHMMSWTMDIIKNADALVAQFKKTMQNSVAHAKIARKLEKVGGGGGIDEK